ncbi:MAG: hypothetical protein AAF846_20500 [Chloroflexota bacterium]
MPVIRDLIYPQNNTVEYPQTKYHHFMLDSGFFEFILVDMLYTPLLNTVLMLFDLRTSMMIEDHDNTGVLVCEGVSKFNCTRPVDSVIFEIGKANVLVENHSNSISATFADFYSERLTITATKMLYYQGAVSDIGDCSDTITIENLTPYIKTTPSLASILQISSMLQLSVKN